MWNFLKNKHDSSFDVSEHARLTSFDDNATFVDIFEPSTVYHMSSLNHIQDVATDAIAVYYDGSFTLIAQPETNYQPE